jgi:hypothetical protein
VRAAGKVVSADGGGGGVQSVNGDVGPAVVLTAVDVGADPTGTAAAAVAAHEAADDPHTVYLLADGSRAMAGDLDMGANAISDVSTVNGVALTSAGGGGLYLDDQGNYVALPSSDTLALQFSDTGNRAPGAALRSGGDLFGNLTPGSGVGQPTDGGVVRWVSWRRTTTPLGSIRISAINAGGGTERAFILVPAAAGIGDGIATGLSFAVNPGEQLTVLWDNSSSATTQDLAVTVGVDIA